MVDRNVVQKNKKSNVILSKTKPFLTSQQIREQIGLSNEVSLDTIKRILRKNNLLEEFSLLNRIYRQFKCEKDDIGAEYKALGANKRGLKLFSQTNGLFI